MQIQPRDMQLLRLVAEFGFLDARQIRELIFHDLSSDTSSDRTFKRLVEAKLLTRIEPPLVGNRRGGNGVYIYRLGAAGVSLFGGSNPHISTIYHSLAIADLHMMLVGLERQGRIQVMAYLTEPSTHQTIGGKVLKPDYYAEIRNRRGEDFAFMFEIDMGTQSTAIRGKLANYREAAADEDWPDNQSVVFVAIDEKRVRTLELMLSRWDKEWREVISVSTASGIAAVLS